MIRTVILDENQKPTEKQIDQIKEATKKEVIFDEDSPELTPTMEKAFRLAAKDRKFQRRELNENKRPDQAIRKQWLEV